jgi:hypothetical protein
MLMKLTEGRYQVIIFSGYQYHFFNFDSNNDFTFLKSDFKKRDIFVIDLALIHIK